MSSSFNLSDKCNIMSDGIKSTQIGTLEHSASHISKYLLSSRQWKFCKVLEHSQEMIKCPQFFSLASHTDPN